MVSFDIGQTRNDYIVNVTAPVATEALNGDKQTEYSMYIINKTVLNRFVKITIRSLETPIPIVLGFDWAQAFNSNFLNNPTISGLKTDARTIDGASGGIASYIQKMDSGLVLNGYEVYYQPVFDPTHTLVHIASSNPWDEGTLQLLKTIHVKRVHS